MEAVIYNEDILASTSFSAKQKDMREENVAINL